VESREWEWNRGRGSNRGSGSGIETVRVLTIKLMKDQNLDIFGSYKRLKSLHNCNRYGNDIT
jgi:hypothetical protein